MAGVLNSNILKAGAKVTTATTANQVILTYTVPAGKTFNLSYLEANVRLTTFAATATLFGSLSLRVNGAIGLTFTAAGAGILSSPVYVELPDALPLQAGDLVEVVCTPAAATSMAWESNMAGFEK